ncbi:MAG: beta-ketoacyl-ACP synthase II [Candidatus Dormibacteraeota bacterium]|nr:beta-ketoacyl-ACP synthase II [Candidatus Dormibacteraeota bacterium]
MAPDQTPRRVVITGMGCITPLGHDAASTWAAMREGQSGVAPVRGFDASDLPSRIAAEVKDFDAVAAVGRKEARRTSRNIQFALVAAAEAVAHSGLDIAAEGDEVGVIVASGVGGFEVIERASYTYRDQGYRRISPFASTAMLADMAAGMIAMEYGARGPNFAVVSACASGGNSVGEAAETIKRGDAVAMLAGGTEAALTGVGMGIFCAVQALSRRNDAPERASRPFDRDRDGFVAAEGAAVLVLEEREHALARGATIHAELVGYGASADASHITQPEPEGRGARLCIERALRKAGRTAADVGYVNAHGTSTQLNDAAESHALRAVLGEHTSSIPVSSTKSMTGHLLGAAGALEAMVCVWAMRDQFLPPTINLENPDPECDLNHVALVGRAATPRLALSTSFGFGGHNSCLAIAAAD